MLLYRSRTTCFASSAPAPPTWIAVKLPTVAFVSIPPQACTVASPVCQLPSSSSFSTPLKDRVTPAKSHKKLGHNQRESGRQREKKGKNGGRSLGVEGREKEVGGSSERVAAEISARYTWLTFSLSLSLSLSLSFSHPFYSSQLTESFDGENIDVG